jgi:hypothetical protein
MGDRERRREFGVVDIVRCLGCGAQYPKPNGGGTARANPGCPACGYLGWVAVNSQSEPLRSDVDQQRRRSA